MIEKSLVSIAFFFPFAVIANEEESPSISQELDAIPSISKKSCVVKKMKSIFFVTLCLATSFFINPLGADEWTNISPPSGESFDVDCCFDNDTNHVYLLWSDRSTHAFKAAYYDFNAQDWHDVSPSPVGNFASVSWPLINSCYDSAAHRIYATWMGITNFCVAYFDGTTWTDISDGLPTGGGFSCGCCYDSANHRLYVTWKKQMPPAEFRAAYYDGSWHDISESLSGISYAQIVSCCYDSTLGRVYVVYQGPDYYLFSAYYDGSWHQLPGYDADMYGVQMYGSVECCYDATHHRVYATWPNGAVEPRAAYFDGSSWIGTPILSSFRCFRYIGCCWNSSNARTYTTWTSLDSLPFNAASYEDSNWTSISPSTSFDRGMYGINCCYDPVNNRVYASWTAEGSLALRAAVYTFTSTTFAMSGSQAINDFAVVRERYNSLSWQNPSTLSAGYRLERNGVLIAVLAPSATTYEDHNRIASVADTYLLSALNAQGTVIATANITIQGDQQ